MERRIIILSDNRTDTPLLGTEHGLSAYMEYGGRRYLLDTGASDLFMLNAEKCTGSGSKSGQSSQSCRLN
jgi:metal-dependent hydrolase (beta-lactamase superfamily II)